MRKEDAVVPTWNPSTGEAEAKGSLESLASQPNLLDEPQVLVRDTFLKR